jgi:hypothetical protein
MTDSPQRHKSHTQWVWTYCSSFVLWAVQFSFVICFVRIHIFCVSLAELLIQMYKVNWPLLRISRLMCDVGKYVDCCESGWAIIVGEGKQFFTLNSQISSMILWVDYQQLYGMVVKGLLWRVKFKVAFMACLLKFSALLDNTTRHYLKFTIHVWDDSWTLDGEVCVSLRIFRLQKTPIWANCSRFVSDNSNRHEALMLVETACLTVNSCVVTERSLSYGACI